MFVWFSAVLFLVCGIALIAVRKRAAHAQALMAGATFPPGCVVAEGAAFILFAIAIALFGHDFLR